MTLTPKLSVWDRIRSRFQPATKQDLNNATNELLMKLNELAGALAGVTAQLNKERHEREGKQ